MTTRNFRKNFAKKESSDLSIFAMGNLAINLSKNPEPRGASASPTRGTALAKRYIIKPKLENIKI